MKLASLLFFALLVYAHRVSDLYLPLAEPLSSFRYGEMGLLGYALIATIVLVGAFYNFALRRHDRPAEAFNTVGAGVLLLIVALTPFGPLHDASAVVLLASVYAHFAILLLSVSQPLMLAHLAFPLAASGAWAFHSYGLWQKTMICYFILLAVVHHHVVVRSARRRKNVPATEPLHSRKIYRLEAGPAWNPRDAEPRANA